MTWTSKVTYRNSFQPQSLEGTGRAPRNAQIDQAQGHSTRPFSNPEKIRKPSSHEVLSDQEKRLATEGCTKEEPCHVPYSPLTSNSRWPVLSSGRENSWIMVRNYKLHNLYIDFFDVVCLHHPIRGYPKLTHMEVSNPWGVLPNHPF